MEFLKRLSALLKQHMESSGPPSRQRNVWIGKGWRGWGFVLFGWILSEARKGNVSLPWERWRLLRLNRQFAYKDTMDVLPRLIRGVDKELILAL